jgi:hypothetical protein
MGPLRIRPYAGIRVFARSLYQYTPWSPMLQEQFKAQKSYDVAPYMPRWYRQPTEQSNRAAADYTDVWSGIFRRSFFGEQANWAKAHTVEYLFHISHEETMLAVAHQAADFFRGYRYVQVPGIDNLSKLVPGAVHQPEGTWEVNNMGRRPAGRRWGRHSRCCHYEERRLRCAAHTFSTRLFPAEYRSEGFIALSGAVLEILRSLRRQKSVAKLCKKRC